ncbi:MAG: hypothetical protein ABMA15_30770, partial [Vicinamibacterales bacterium]
MGWLVASGSPVQGRLEVDRATLKHFSLTKPLAGLVLGVGYHLALSQRHMTLPNGTKLGAFEIVAPLGAGGM